MSEVPLYSWELVDEEPTKHEYKHVCTSHFSSMRINNGLRPPYPPPYRGHSPRRNSPPPQDHQMSLDSPSVGSLEGSVSYERGTPVNAATSPTGLQCPRARLEVWLQGYLAHKKATPP